MRARLSLRLRFFGLLSPLQDLIDHEEGVRLTQSLAILRYIARISKRDSLLTGSATLSWAVDMLGDQAMDLRNAMSRTYYGAKSDADVQEFKVKGLIQLA